VPIYKNICQKANRPIGFLKRNLNIVKSDIKEKAYTTLYSGVCKLNMGPSPVERHKQTRNDTEEVS